MENGEPRTRKGDWGLFSTLEELGTSYKELYASPRRLAERAYFDPSTQRFILPDGPKANLDFPLQFINSVRSHVEQALESGYADYLVYADMGHVHLLAPVENKENLMKNLGSPDIVFLYHTAELIRLRHGDWFDGELVNDPWLQWRYFSRNFIGRNDPTAKLNVRFAKNQKYNTIRELPGHRQFGIVYMSANHKGCFSTQGLQAINFDLSLSNY